MWFRTLAKVPASIAYSSCAGHAEEVANRFFYLTRFS